MNPGAVDLDGLNQIIRTKEQVPLEIDAATAALVVVDLQRYFTEPDHPLGRVMERVMDEAGTPRAYFDRVTDRVLPNARRLIDAFRALGLPVYFTGFGTVTGDGSDLPPYMQGFDAMGRMFLGEPVFPSPDDASWQIDERVAPLPGETVLPKTTASAFPGTGLEEELRERGVRWVVVTGVVTECCVGQTARDAAERGFDVIVVEDACTGMSDYAHRILIDSFAAVFGHRRSTEAVLDLVAAGRAAVLGRS